MKKNIDPEEAKGHLDQLDKEGGVNNVSEKVTSLGKISTYGSLEEVSAAAESPWKLLNFNTLPSLGLFYPEKSELLIRSAKTKEIRHWSTLDEHDPLDVLEKINFILNSCTKFKIKGNPTALNFNDYLEIDRYHILFRIYELTFPNQENKLFAYIKCSSTTCGHKNQTQVTTQNLKGFEYPDEIMKWYSKEERCFVITSEKLNETLYFYMPSSGTTSRLRQKKKADDNRGNIKPDKSFYSQAKYLIDNWRNADLKYLTNLKMSTLDWSERKFLIIYKFVELLENASINKAICICEKCRTQTDSAIFLGGSFTVKDIFIISAGLDELI
jgi:hypothetical protein